MTLSVTYVTIGAVSTATLLLHVEHFPWSTLFQPITSETASDQDAPSCARRARQAKRNLLQLPCGNLRNAMH